MANISDLTSIKNINASADRGGWQCTLSTLNDTDALDTHREIIVLWRGAFGGAFGPIRTAFHGNVLPVSSRFNIGGSITDLVAETTDGYLRKMFCQGIGFAEVDVRAHYHQFGDDDSECPATVMAYEMTSGKMVKHIIGYYDDCVDIGPNWVAHTNLVHHPTSNPEGWIDLTYVDSEPFSTVGNPDGSMKCGVYIVRETDNLWSRIIEIARNEFFIAYFDKNDVFHYTRHPMFKTVLPPPVMTFDAGFLSAEPIIEFREQGLIRQVILHAVTDDADTIHSYYPASPTHVYGNVVELTRIRCNDQDTLDNWCERQYKYENRPWTVQWTAPGLCGLLFEIMDRIQITYTGTIANGVHIDWDREKFWVHDIDVRPNDDFSGVSVFTLEAENS